MARQLRWKAAEHPLQHSRSPSLRQSLQNPALCPLCRQPGGLYLSRVRKQLPATHTQHNSHFEQGFPLCIRLLTRGQCMIC